VISRIRPVTVRTQTQTEDAAPRASLAQTLSRPLGWPRAVCDYLAGMTDRYAMAEHRRLLGAR